MICPNFKKLKTNGTTMFVFPGTAEDKNFETQNDNYNMRLSHYVLVNIPRQVVSNEIMNFTKANPTDQLYDPGAFYENSTSITPAAFKDQLVESLRNYVANHEATIRNSKVNSNTFYYDTFEPYTTTEKIFWKWAKKVGIIDFEVADTNLDFFGADTKYDNLGPSGNNDYFREYLWRERTNTIYSLNLAPTFNPVIALGLPASYQWIDSSDVIQDETTPITATAGYQFATIVLANSSQLKPGDYILMNVAGLDSTPNYSTTQSYLKVVAIATDTVLNDTLVLEVDSTVLLSDFGTASSIDLYNAYERFVQFISEITGVNNVQLPDKSYTETYAYISHQHGQIPYALWNIKQDNNYKPNLEFPILASEIQQEIQGGENPNNPILINPTTYPGDIWGQFDTGGFKYTTQSGNILKRSGEYYGNYAITNIAPSLKWPEFRSKNIDGLTLNLDINDYAKAVSYLFPIESFNEFGATSFDNIAPKDFKFNAILWYYTIEDISGNTTKTATNLYGIEFLDTPANDIDILKTKIPEQTKLVSNGLQDGNSFTWSLDTNLTIESGTEVPSFDPDKVYSLFGMELYYEALTRLTYFNDQLTNFIASNSQLAQQVNNLTGLVYTQQSLESIRARMNNLEDLLNIYSTLQIGPSDAIIPYLDTTVNPPLLRLNSIDKQYGFVYQFDTKSMFTEFTNTNSLTEIAVVDKQIPVANGKDFLVVINNNDNSVPVVSYDATIEMAPLNIYIEKDLYYKQKMDILILPKVNNEVLSVTNIVNEPINDKKINLFIKYDDGNVVQDHLIGEFSLPVLKNYNGTNLYDETHVGLNETPQWKIRNVFYSKSNTNERVFSFIIEDDLINKINPSDRGFIDRLTRVFIEDFLIEDNPSAPTFTHTDLSSQYPVYDNPSYVRSNVIDTEVLTPGTGYTPGLSTHLGLTSVNVPNVTIDVEIEANLSGEIINVELINSVGLTSLDAMTSPFDFAVSGGTGFISIIVKPVTRIDIAVNININQQLFVLLSNYDTLLNINSLPLNTRKNIDKYLYKLPTLTFLKGYKISLARISDNPVIPLDFIDQRYNIKIDKL